MKISRAFVQRNLISYSASCTCFPGRLPRTVKIDREGAGDNGREGKEEEGSEQAKHESQ